MSPRKKSQPQAIVIYKDSRGRVELRADVHKETIWATQAQVADIFGVERSVVTKHIGNVLKSREVDTKSNVQKMHIANSDKPVALYSLDMILAVGYRANSARAIIFRRWATKVLRDYIVKGAALNADRIRTLHEQGIRDLQAKIGFIQTTIEKRALDQSEAQSLLAVIKDYANSWLLLQQYDEGALQPTGSRAKSKQRFDYDLVRPAINALKEQLVRRKEAGDLFGNERDGAFGGILRTIYQTFGGKQLYPTLEEKAAHLLYFVIKDHPFSDGNKRIGSFLFILFLDRNGILYRKNRERKINDNALVALALLVAESNPKEKEQLIALITRLLV